MASFRIQKDEAVHRRRDHPHIVILYVTTIYMNWLFLFEIIKNSLLMRSTESVH